MAVVVDIFLMSIILINGARPAQRFIQPLVEQSLISANQQMRTIFNPTIAPKTTKEVFAFVPGSSNKDLNLALDSLHTLAYFDLPVLEDGSLNKASMGYRSFFSDGPILLEYAHQHNAKVDLTFSMYNEDINGFLDNSSAIQVFTKESIQQVKDSGVDGVTLVFEYQGQTNRESQQKFTSFINDYTQAVHQELPLAQVHLALADNIPEHSLYNLKNLSQVVDRIFVIASSFPVPESQNGHPTSPTYGSIPSRYWGEVGKALDNFARFMPSDKLVMETAWYGDGDHYPLYVPKSQPDPIGETHNPVKTLDKDLLDRLVSQVPAKARGAARRNIPFIVKALEEEGIFDSNVLSYALATIEHETDSTFEPIEEIQGSISARRLGYEGGKNYFGRGFIQLTHLRNYRMIGQRLGMGDQLVDHPELASEPEVAAKVLAAFFKDNDIARRASNGDFVSARSPVNPDRNGYRVAKMAYRYESEMELNY